MLENKMVLELVARSQKLIDELCEKESIPKIPVIFKQRLENPLMAAQFDKDKYQITITPLCSGYALIHEFNHYVVTLLANSEDLEERLVERGSHGLYNEIQKDNPDYEKTLIELDKLFTEVEKQAKQ